MPDEKKTTSREDALECLKNFPKILERHVDLVRKMEETFKTKKEWELTECLENWTKYDNFEKMYFLGWMRAAIKRMGIANVAPYLNLLEKRKLDYQLVIILSRATQDEIKAFQAGEDAISVQR